MPRTRSPKRGSRSYSPRKRTKHVKGRVHYWPKLKDGPKLVGYAGYKAGMTHLYYVEDRRRVPEYGTEVKSAATIIDTPPLLVCAVRAYKQTFQGLEVLSEAWMANQPRDFFKRINFTTDADPNKGLTIISDNLDKIVELRVIVATQPREASTPQKVPDFMEIPVSGGSIEEQLEFAKNLLGKKVGINDVFEPVKQ